MHPDRQRAPGPSTAPPPARSVLVGIEPLGLGTPHAESLASYVVRLAAAHAMAPVQLVTHVIIPSLERADPLEAARWREQFTQLSRRPATFSAHSPAAVMWVEVLEALTLRGDLLGLTTIRWRRVLPIKDLMRTHQAWCPRCYAEWAAAGLPLYMPLVWQFSALDACVDHGIRLESRCGQCDQSIPVITARMEVGRCPKCGSTLGDAERGIPLGPSETDWSGHVAHQLGTLVAALASDVEPDGTGVAAAVAVARARTGLPWVHFARRIGVGQPTTSAWQDDRSRPSLPMLLRIARGADVPLVALLTGDVAAIGSLGELGHEWDPPIPRSTTSHRFADWAMVETGLEEALRTHPPVSLAAVVRSLQVDMAAVKRRFPDLSRAIAARLRSWRREERVRRDEQERALIRAVFDELIAAGIYPSKRQIEKRLPVPGLMRRPHASAFWRELHREAGPGPR